MAMVKYKEDREEKTETAAQQRTATDFKLSDSTELLQVTLTHSVIIQFHIQRA